LLLEKRVVTERDGEKVQRVYLLSGIYRGQG